MILFLEDWQRYPSAIVHINTKNQSFVRLASVYRAMGIKNHAFLLALINPELEFADPFDPKLTIEQMAAVALEARINPFYFFREIARVPAIGSTDSTPLEANRGNISLFWLFFNHVMTILIQIRQTGKSLSTDVLMTLLMNVICTNTAINLLTKDDTLRRKNVERLKEIASELPRYLQQKTRDDVNNGEEITIKSLGNTYTTHVPQSSPKRAYNMGRGLTSAIFHIDEPPFQPNIAIALPAALAATGAAVDKAKKAGTPYGTILTTTAGKKDDKDGRFVYNLLCDAAVWTEKFLDAKNAEELEWMIRRNSRAGKFIVNCTFNHQQLGKTDEWLKTKLEESLQTGDDANRDYFNMWTSGSQSSPLPTHVLEVITASVEQVAFTKISEQSYITRWYIPEDQIEYRMANGKFILGMDTSEASGGDDISFVLVDAETLETVAVGTYNETNLITFAEWICQVMMSYPNITAVIERRSTGAMLLDYLLLMLPQHGIDPFKRLFNRAVQDYDENPERWKEIRQPMSRRSSDIYTRYKTTFGFATSGAGAFSRSELYSTTLQNAAKRAGSKVKDKSLIDQIAGLVVRNGRVDHEVGEHDDLVIGWLLCHWFLTMGKNLSHYDIDVRRVMAGVQTRPAMTPQQEWEYNEQLHIRERIEELSEQLSEELDDYVSIRLEQELRMLDRQVILQQGEIYSVDELIRKAVEAKRTRRRGFDPRRGRQEQPWQVNQYQHGVLSDRPLSTREIYGYR